MNPVSWWHDLQGGKIAEERPPPPGADQPYPNLASVPPKPEAPDRAALANIATALIADRTNAQHAAAAAPIADPSCRVPRLPCSAEAPCRRRRRHRRRGQGRRAPQWPRPTRRLPRPPRRPQSPGQRSRRGAGARQGSTRHGGECAACPARRHGAVARRCGGADHLPCRLPRRHRRGCRAGAAAPPPVAAPAPPPPAVAGLRHSAAAAAPPPTTVATATPVTPPPPTQPTRSA